MLKRLLLKIYLIATLLVVVVGTRAQLDMTYQEPHEDIRQLLDAPQPPLLRYINSSGTQAVLLYRHSFKSIAELSEPELRLAGLRINPQTFNNSREQFYFEISLFDLNEKKEIPISGLPSDPKLSNFSASPDERKISFTQTTAEGVELWFVDRETSIAQKLTDPILNANLGNPAEWLADSEHLLAQLRTKSSEDLITKAEVVPSGPTISVNQGQKAQNRTYQDLLKDEIDEQNFTSLGSSTIHKVSISGEMNPWLGEGIYADISISPNGQYALVETIHSPYSYLVPYYRFPARTEIYDMDGNLVELVHAAGLIEELPQGRMSVAAGKRNIRWRNDKPATIYWSEALDEGDPAIEVEYRDAVYQRHVPFEQPAEELLKTINRFSSIIWGNENIAVANDLWWNTRNRKTYLFNPSRPNEEVEILFDVNYQDRYGDPGDFATTRNNFGNQALLIDRFVEGSYLFLTGDGYSDEGIHPFIDRLDLNTGETHRLWQAPKVEKLETIVELIDMHSGKFLTRIESADEFPNYYFRNIQTESKPEQVTSFPNPFEALAEVSKEVISYQRGDGIELSGTLYLPPGFHKSGDEKLPMLLWAYPREYKDAQSAGQITSSPYQFTYPSYGSPVFWVLRGFAVLDRAAFPIIGEGSEEPNDQFVNQLVSNAEAAIDAVDRLGYIDRDRVAVGGHSYGAFMTANLLSHSNLFAAGIARSGAYNRTLTPFGFQSEERTYWDAPEVYYTMSPFMHADKMKTPLLLIHGEADNNSGTYPMQSQRYFNALKGLGATVRLVMLPKESHGYRAKESIYHVLWEQDQWLEKYVKNKNGVTAMKP